MQGRGMWERLHSAGEENVVTLCAPFPFTARCRACTVRAADAGKISW